ncbi:hypothetical protein TVAG_126220 [Trichomonas vaginalis G3]|uniref:Non-structural maintenance of chromosomes element 4 n=1 Tax=Trichomonas vaginalis (strain ATCC PRA-98 / G3) TaxID=412133 RepID=A2ED10_TRIV3|nr:non-structural maintenance of chromosomes element 4 family [Trichomonas vaginalis G3]EAY09461.1 hypothetical protein TVAG_126220 [Trichomonas vaginalis G3]KAI5500644.1 non-structural maintenance of chromosomes element 4 family [Trichomonas vaginalis G3]|eukprot:XP_001321684.1 hypothetical protein [Trichomonas vaginalis G3]
MSQESQNSQSQRKSYLPSKDFASNLEPKDVIKKYDDINQQIIENEKDLITNATPRNLSEILIQMDKMQSLVKKPSVFEKDLKSINRVTRIAVEQGNQVTLSDSAFNLASVHRNLCAKYPTRKEKQFDLAQLGDIFIRSSLIAPRMNIPMLYGLDDFHVKPRQKRATQSQVRDEVTADEIKVGYKKTNEKAHSLTERGRKFFKEISNSGARPLADTISTEEGFDAMIQKAFELAHLVRDGRVCVDIENHEIVAKAAGSDMKDIDGKGRKKCVLHLRYKDYQNMLSLLNSEKPEVHHDIEIDDLF